MKKLFFILPIILLISAGCSTQQNNTISQPNQANDQPISASNTESTDWQNARIIALGNINWTYRYPSDWTYNDYKPGDKVIHIDDTVGQSGNETASEKVDGAIASVVINFTGGHGTLNVLCFVSHPMYKFRVIDPNNAKNFLQISLFDQSVNLDSGIDCQNQSYMKKISAPSPVGDPAYQNYDNFIKLISQTLHKQ